MEEYNKIKNFNKKLLYFYKNSNWYEGYIQYRCFTGSEENIATKEKLIEDLSEFMEKMHDNPNYKSTDFIDELIEKHNSGFIDFFKEEPQDK